MIIIEVIPVTSRMERYYKPSSQTSKRSERNQELYREIYEVGEYSNIEGIATIEKSNEVDITKIKNMLKNREQYQKQRQFRQITQKKEEAVQEEVVPFETEKNYDIRDILNKAKSTKKEEQKYHRLDQTGYNILKNLKEKSMQEETTDELRELIDTITSNSELNQLATRELSLDMFDDLKSQGNTTIQDRDSIKALLEEAKKEEFARNKEKEEMDNSFYTSSLNIDKKDFEEAMEASSTGKQTNKVLKIVISVLLGIVIASVIFLVFHLLK